MEGERLTGGNDSIDRGESGRSMVGMDLISLPRVMAQHDVGSNRPDRKGYLRAQCHGVLELSIDVPEMGAVLYSKDIGGRTLLIPASLDEGIGVFVRVPRTLRPVGHDQNCDLSTGGGPPSQSRSCAEFGIVGVCADGQDSSRHEGRCGIIAHYLIDHF